MDFIQILQNPDDAAFETTWSTFFLDVNKVRSLAGKITATETAAIISAGQRWSGAGWNTSRASKALYNLTAVPLVKAEWRDYRNAFLYALSLYLEVEVQELDLGDKVAEAAFALLSVFTGGADDASGAVGMMTDWQPDVLGSNPAGGFVFGPSATEEPEEEVQLSWDQPKVALPVELSYIWAGTVSGERKLDLKTILGSIPRFVELPAQAPANNHRLDGHQRRDKQDREWQQKLLHAVRILAHGYGQLPLQAPGQAPPTWQVLLQQVFQLLTELYVRIENTRKDNSIPGSTAPTGEVLFDKQELASALQRQRINRFGGKGRWTGKCHTHAHNLVSATGRGFGGFGRGSGQYNYYGHGGPFRGGKGKGPYYMKRPWGKGGKGMAPRSANGMEPGRASAPTPSLKESPPPSSKKECFLQESAPQSGLVGPKLLPRGRSSDRTWCPKTLGITEFTVLSGPKQKYFRHKGCTKHFGRIRISGGCKKTFAPRNLSSFGSLVHHPKEGWTKRKVEIDLRLPRNKPIFSAQALQIGPSAAYFSSVAKKHVGCKKSI